MQTDDEHTQPDLDTAALALEDAARQAYEIATQRIRASRMAARRAVRDRKPESYIVVRARRQILELIALGDSLDEIAAMFVAATPGVALNTGNLIRAIRRLIANEKNAATARTRAASTVDTLTGQVTDKPGLQTDAATGASPDPATVPPGPPPQAQTGTPPGAATNTGARATATQEKYRSRKPSWADGRYRHLDCLQRHEGEADADYHWRMWHTLPPWADEFPRKPDEPDDKYAYRCWANGSPEERAEKLQNRPRTAR